MWYFESNGGQQGPESTEQILARVEQREILPRTLVWREGMKDWTPLEQVPELQPTEPQMQVPAVGQPMGPYQPPQHMQGMPGAPVHGMMPRNNGFALTSMIVGICALVLAPVTCGMSMLLGIPAIVFGHIGKAQINNHAPMQTGVGMALTGLILGYLTTVLTVAGIVALVLSEI